jgi:hypothetical protein
MQGTLFLSAPAFQAIPLQDKPADHEAGGLRKMAVLRAAVDQKSASSR